MSITKVVWPTSVLVVVGVFLSSCGDSAVTPADIAGTYDATVFQTSSGGQSTNQLSRGASITITLSNDLNMSGMMFVPATPPDTADFDADLTGTWTLLRNTVLLDPVEDTFLENVDWQVVSGNMLTGSGTFDGVTVEATFRRR